MRIQGLLERGAAEPPRRILVTTFSNRARDNIRDRLRQYVSAASVRDRVTISNFHGLSARIFRAHASVIGLSFELIIPESDWVGEQCRSRALDFALAAAVQDLLRTTKQEPIDDAEVDLRLSRAGLPDAVDIEHQRVAEGRLTYDDLPRMAELILAEDAVADLYRHHFDAVVVDEFQDLTPQQLRIVNRIGFGKTTFGGDLAQGIYGFAGARPREVDKQIRAECPEVIEFADSHRSSPAVLEVVNTLTSLTGGTTLAAANPESWPGGGLATQVVSGTVDAEAQWVVKFAQFVLGAAPRHRIGILARTAGRRRFVDAAVESSGLPSFRWDDGVLDTDTARIVKSMLSRLNLGTFQSAVDPLEYLRRVSGLDALQEPNTREALWNALNWCCDLLQQGLDADTIKSRIRVGDETSLLSVPGVHLLTGHVGKGQQFDWVLIVGAEEGCIPDFRAKSQEALQEEARVLSVMVSRARHGVVIMRARRVPAASGVVFSKTESRFWRTVSPACLDESSAITWIKSAPWQEINER